MIHRGINCSRFPESHQCTYCSTPDGQAVHTIDLRLCHPAVAFFLFVALIPWALDRIHIQRPLHPHPVYSSIVAPTSRIALFCFRLLLAALHRYLLEFPLTNIVQHSMSSCTHPLSSSSSTNPQLLTHALIACGRRRSPPHIYLPHSLFVV